MNTKLVKGVAALVCALSALAMTYQSGPKAAEPGAGAKVDGNAKDLLITNPEKPADYGIGMYKIEGLVPKGSDVTLYLDRQELKSFKANTEDGSYLEDVEVAEAGKHTLVAQYKDAKGEKVLRKLEFTASSEKNPTHEKSEKDEIAAAEESTNDSAEATNLLPENHGEDVNMAEDPTDPNAATHRKENGVKDTAEVAKPKPAAKTKPAVGVNPKAIAKVKPGPTTKPKAVDPKHPKAPVKPAVKPKAKPVGKKAPVKAAFVISSHSNFNVVPHGILQIGGKGKPGDRIMLFVDNKPSMRGTIKANGRWKFPVKVSGAGFRKITAQNMRTREVKWVKLKIK